MGKYDEAFEDLTRLLEIKPDNTIALRYRGEVNYIMKRYNESIANLEELRIKPNDIWAKKIYKLVKGFQIKLSRHIMGKYDEAFEDLTRLLEIKPDNTIALRHRDEVNYIIKRYNESIANLKKLRIKPNDIWAKKNALILEYQEKDYFIIGEYENMLVCLIDNLTKSLEKEAAKANYILLWTNIKKTELSSATPPNIIIRLSEAFNLND
ncbi:tetratricopeptide repeat protein [Gigaspora margarita]|uniref:Tetratricopeptide repeat protein n=1 Tax=Gigaspora margarita TaxID=4874 RepID=A0A8H4EK47_GIGMA|nr:tetratricopeptide repeat protein [Gigaspora margarita]